MSEQLFILLSAWTVFITICTYLVFNSILKRIKDDYDSKIDHLRGRITHVSSGLCDVKTSVYGQDIPSLLIHGKFTHVDSLEETQEKQRLIMDYLNIEMKSVIASIKMVDKKGSKNDNSN